MPEPRPIGLLDPKNDYVFKRLFADSPELLAALINAVRWRLPPVVAVTVKNPQIDREELRGKYIVLDILAEDAAGHQFDVEMRDADRPEVTLGQEIQLHLIELPKADRLGLCDRPGALAAWITLFKHWQEEQIMSEVRDEPVLAVYDKLKGLSADARTRRLAFVRERALRDERSLLRDAREEGRKEALTETALNLIRTTALDDPAIATATGLPAATVAALRQGLASSATARI